MFALTLTLDNLGEASQKPLTECLSSLIAELTENHVISWVKWTVGGLELPPHSRQ